MEGKKSSNKKLTADARLDLITTAQSVKFMILCTLDAQQEQ
jgi:hypothetical protein